MAKTIKPQTDLATTSPLTVPDYLKGKAIVGADELREYMVIPRFRVIQKQSDTTAIETYGMGTFIISPNGVTLCKKDESVRVVPLYFYPEWCTFSDIKLKGQAPFIRFSTRDPKSPLVLKCRDPKLRVEPDPENAGMVLKHMEQLNFVCKVVDHEGFSDIAVLTFSGSGHTDGRRFNNLIRARGASIFAGVYELNVGPRKNNKGDWFGIAATNPTENAWVSAEDYAVYEQVHKQVIAEFAAGNVKVVGDVDEEAPEGSNEM